MKLATLLTTLKQWCGGLFFFGLWCLLQVRLLQAILLLLLITGSAYVVFGILPGFAQTARNVESLTRTLDTTVQQSGPQVTSALTNANAISQALQPRANQITQDLMVAMQNARRVAQAEQENWNSPELIRQRNQIITGTNALVARANIWAEQTQGQTDQFFSQLNNQVVPNANAALVQTTVFLTNLTKLASTLDQDAGTVLRSLNEATIETKGAVVSLTRTLNDPRLSQLLDDFSAISRNGVTATEQVALMSKYGAAAAAQAPETAQRINAILKGAQGWQRVFNIVRTAAAVLGIVWQ